MENTCNKKALLNKYAWVTGSSRGIGRVIADHLASLGASVAIHGTGPLSTRAFSEAKSLKSVSEKIAADHETEVMAVWGDLSDPSQVKSNVKQIHNSFKRIDILVNCAGGDIGVKGTSGPKGGKPVNNDPVNISFEDMKSVLDRNLITCINCCREVAPEMIRRKSGSIVNIGSVAGLKGSTNSAIYATAKAGVHHYSRCLASMLRPYNVRVNVIAPGDIVTPRFKESREIEKERMLKNGSLENYGWPINVAEAVEFFTTEKSSFITGQVLRVDGGKQLWFA